MRTTLIKDEYIHLESETFVGFYFIHVEVFKWSRDFYSIYLNMLDDIKELFRKEDESCIYMLAGVEDVKLLKFADMFEFTKLTTCNGNHILYLDTDQGNHYG